MQVQGTINGLGERCGNANLVSIIGNLQLKLGYNCVPQAKLKTLQETAMLVYELANITPNRRQAYVGGSAFAHKAGLHVWVSSAMSIPTNTSIRRCSATIVACCSRNSRAAPTSSTRRANSASNPN